MVRNNAIDKSLSLADLHDLPHMEIVESLMNIGVQDPPEEEFSSADLGWTKYGTPEERHDHVALIPVSNGSTLFIIGECSDAEFPTRFHIER
ncbi:hypothetical protein Tsubulata_050035 [Turnera subulata]|uniref:Uncharacterized protein n=1 Tax=Turnera subulata TaxID=218843 RepID=A0A9Q0JJ87_9ROSI|nr:hypothetical protein Tsubulata_050035 [Turnera subulata]